MLCVGDMCNVLVMKGSMWERWILFLMWVLNSFVNILLVRFLMVGL